MKFIHYLTPTHFVSHLTCVEPESLVKMGKKLVLLDIDNTLVGWKLKEVSPEIRSWVQKCHLLGLKTCIISNAYNLKKLKSVSSQIESDFMLGFPKPFSHMFKKALKKFDVFPKEAIMIGDQIFTDVLGGNLMQIETVLVERLVLKDGIFTKFNRFLEKPLRKKAAYGKSL